jgi:hypothetical protein
MVEVIEGDMFCLLLRLLKKSFWKVSFFTETRFWEVFLNQNLSR